MQLAKQIAALVTSVALALPLVACGGASGGGSAPASSAEEPAPAEAKFEGIKPLDSKGLTKAADYAIGWAQAAIKDSEDLGDEDAETASGIEEDFLEANSLYGVGDYGSAATAYENLLKKSPKHFGASVNVVLAELQLEKNDVALKYALRAVYLFPEEIGCLLNAQAAATACGYADADIDAELTRVLGEANGTSVGECLTNYSEASGIDDYTRFYEYYAYNSIWNRIETSLYNALHPADDDAESPEDVYAELLDGLEYAERFSDDEDTHQLLAFLEAVGKQLGLKAK